MIIKVLVLPIIAGERQYRAERTNRTSEHRELEPSERAALLRSAVS